MISASDLREGMLVLIKTRGQYPISSGWPGDAKWVLGSVVTINYVNGRYFKIDGSQYAFPIDIIESIISDDNCEIETDSIESFIDLI